MPVILSLKKAILIFFSSWSNILSPESNFLFSPFFCWCFLLKRWFVFDGTLSYFCFHSHLWYVRNIFFDGFFNFRFGSLSTATIGVTSLISQLLDL